MLGSCFLAQCYYYVSCCVQVNTSRFSSPERRSIPPAQKQTSYPFHLNQCNLSSPTCSSLVIPLLSLNTFRRMCLNRTLANLFPVRAKRRAITLLHTFHHRPLGIVIGTFIQLLEEAINIVVLFLCLFGRDNGVPVLRAVFGGSGVGGCLLSGLLEYGCGDWNLVFFPGGGGGGNWSFAFEGRPLYAWS
jgi:hypothetical protein